MTINVIRPFKQVFAGRSAMLYVLIGALLTFAGAFAAQFGALGSIANAIITAITIGYMVTVMGNETRANGNFVAALPAWHTNALDLLRRGFSLAFAVFIYGTIATVFITLSHEVINHVADATLATGPLLSFLALIYNGVGLVTLVSVGLFLPMLAAHFANEDSLRSLVDVRTIFAKVFANKLNTLLAVVVSAAVLFASALISEIPYGGFAFAGFLSQLVLGSLWAQTYRLAR